MAKEAIRYLKVDPWLVVEEGFHPGMNRVSESIFSLANEHMGIRGYFDEGYSGESLLGSFVNGVYEEKEILHPVTFKGMATRHCFMVNTIDWLYTRISIKDEVLDMSKSDISGFSRVLDMKRGTYSRELIWHLKDGQSLKITFLRFLSMVTPSLGCQRITFQPIDFTGKVNIVSGLDFTPIHVDEKANLWTEVDKEASQSGCAILAKTNKTGQRLFSGMKLKADMAPGSEIIEREKLIALSFSLDLVKGIEQSVEKLVSNNKYMDRSVADHDIWEKGLKISNEIISPTFEDAYQKHVKYWEKAWENLDIEIEGDPENQQGIRFCIFNLNQTYNGNDSTLNIPAKGLTGEGYSGWTWWDTETYCLPFYLFNNPKAARSLLKYRYNYLPQALDRAIEMDCEGACYPMGTIDGTESDGVWQHGNLEVHVSAAIPFGIWHYMKVCKDKSFLFNYGAEILVQSSRYFASRGHWNPNGGYGIYGVMGPDEFHMMVNNNCYTNVMAKKVFEYTLEVLKQLGEEAPDQYRELCIKTDLKDAEQSDWIAKADKMIILQDKDTGIFEQHEGYFTLPHIDVKAIPPDQIPIYRYWAYDRIFRYDMIKQPDVLLFLFLFSQQYSHDVKKANYEYYEPRCSHESSLSPAIHSILAAEINKMEDAQNFFHHACRLDLDDFNRNTWEGLHITSMVAAWMNIVYGFGGMRSDGEKLIFNPTIPDHWNSFSFRLIYEDSLILIKITKQSATFKLLKGSSVKVKIYAKEYEIDENGVEIIHK